MERFFKAKGIHPEFGGNLFSYCTDGPQLLRLCIQAEAMQKSIQLKPYFFHYFDLRKEFQKLYKRPASSIKDMLECILFTTAKNCSVCDCRMPHKLPEPWIKTIGILMRIIQHCICSGDTDVIHCSLRTVLWLCLLPVPINILVGQNKVGDQNLI